MPRKPRKINEAENETESRKQIVPNSGLSNVADGWQAVFDLIPDAIMLLDGRYNILKANKATADLLNLPMTGIIGRQCHKLIHGTDHPYQNCPVSRLNETKKREESEIYIEEKGIWVQVSVEPEIDNKGEIVRIVHIVKDITARKLAEQALRQQSAALLERNRELHCLYSLSDLIEEKGHSLEEIYKGVIEIIPSGWKYPEVAAVRLVVEGIEYISKNWKDTPWKMSVDIIAYNKNSGILEMVYLKEKPGSYEGPFLKEERNLLNAIAERLGHVIERQRAEQELSRTADRYRSILDEMSDAYFEVDLSGNFTFVNPAICINLQYTPDELLKMNFRATAADEDIPALVTAFNHVYRTGELNKGIASKMKRNDGTTAYVETSTSLLKDLQGNVTGFRCVSRDITERILLERRLAEMAMHDALTGLPNRILLDDRFNIALSQAQRRNTKMGVIALDLDKFKEINDTLGHNVGDQLLIAVAARLSRVVRISDTVARIGGDEFVVVMPEITRPDEAAAVAQRILEACREPFDLSGRAVYVTTSIGIALYPEHGDNPKELLSNADAAMYYAKEHGRNRFYLYESGNPKS